MSEERNDNAAGSEVAMNSNLPMNPVDFDYGEDAGLGMENMTGDDIALPFLNVVQDNSPEKKSNNAKFIDGIKEGDLFNTVTREVYPSPLAIVPVMTEHVYVEWVPRDQGGGFVAVHAPTSDVVMEAKKNSNGPKLKKGENDLVETFYLYAMVLADVNAEEIVTPIVIPFTSTKIKRYKQIMTRVRTFKKPVPLFAHRLVIKSVDDTNKKGDFKNFDLAPALGTIMDSLIPPKDANGLPHPLMIEAKAMLESIQSGTAKVNHEAMGNATTTEDEEEVF